MKSAPQNGIGIRWEIVAAGMFGAVIFGLLLVATGGYLIATLVTVAALIGFGVVHYVVWGYYLSKQTERERVEAARATLAYEESPTRPADEFILVLDNRERDELIEAVERALAQRAEFAHHGRGTGGYEDQQQAALKGVLDRVRGYGA